MHTHTISSQILTLESVVKILSKDAKIVLSEEAKSKIARCREYLDKKIAESSHPLYELIPDSVPSTIKIFLKRTWKDFRITW